MTRTLISQAQLRRGRGRILYWSVLALVVAVFTLVFLGPLYWMVTGALKSGQEIAQTPPTLFPQDPQLQNYVDAWTQLNLAKLLFNTFYYAAGAVFFQLVFDTAAAYSLSKLRPIFGKVVLGLMLASLMLPASALLIPAYLTVSDLRLLNSPWALWLPAAANAFNIYVLKRFFDQIPNDLLDAARIDGAGEWRIWWSLMMPLVRPSLAAVAIFTFVTSWNDFLWPSLMLPTMENKTLPVGLAALQGFFSSDFRAIAAGVTMTVLPILAFFILVQRYFVRGLAGAVKG